MTGIGVRNALPPRRVVGVLNTLLRPALASPVGRALGSVALLEFTGRRTGTRYRVPVGWHRLDGDEVVLTPARWQVNFAGGAAVTVHHRGRVRTAVATRHADAGAVADCVNALLATGTRPAGIGLHIPGGGPVAAADVAGLGRAVLRFDFAG